MRVKITYTKDSPYKGKIEVVENITEVHYNFDTPLESSTAFESDNEHTGFTVWNKFIKEFEVTAR
jgi:hypothetical protein